MLKQLLLSPAFQKFYFGVCLPLLRRQPFSSRILGPAKGSHRSLPDWIEGLKGSSRPGEGRRGRIRCIGSSHTVAETPPVVAIPRVPQAFSQSANRCPDTFVAELAWGRVATKNIEVISSDDRTFDDLFYREEGGGNPAWSLILPWLPRAVRKRGTYATIATPRTGNYYHWLNDCLPRLWLLERSGCRDYKLIVPAPLLPFQSETLALLGFSAETLVPFQPRHLALERLLVPSLVNAASRSSPEASRWLREKLLSALPARDTPLPRRVFVSRKLATKRRLLNEAEIMRFLQRYGFISFETETLPVEDQIRLFRQAEVVVAPHGAGLANVLFINKESLLIELLPSRKVKTSSFSLASAVGAKYACVTDEPENGEETFPGSQTDLDFSILVSRLARCLGDLGVGTPKGQRSGGSRRA